MNLYQETYLADILREIASGLLAPTLIVIIALILVSIFFIGQVIVEFFAERRHFKQNMAAIINDISEAGYENVSQVVIESKLLQYQKAALVTVSKNMGLDDEPLFALAQSEVNSTEKVYKKRLAWTDVISKVAPMLGLMGTLIPLGPGIVALGQGDTVALSQSLLVAFDSTICGLVCAVVALIISKIRSGWYTEYINTVESLMTCVVDKASHARTRGVQLPANYRRNAYQDMKTTSKQGVKAPQSASSTSVPGQEMHRFEEAVSDQENIDQRITEFIERQKLKGVENG